MTLAAPWFLLAALAAAIPVLLHMISRHRAPLIPFATLRFLKLSSEQTRRRRRLHDVTLMALRIAVLVLVAVGLAGPTLRQLPWGGAAGDGAAIVVVLDNSASMATRDGQTARWPRALAAAGQILDQAGPRDRAALIVPRGPARAAYERLQQDLAPLRQALAACRLAYRPADLAESVRRARALLEDVDSAHKEIYVITDMQAVCWDHLDQRADQDLTAAPAPVLLINVGGPPGSNAALARGAVTGVVPVAGLPLEATVEVTGAGSTPQQRHLELHVDGAKLLTSAPLALSPGQTVRHTFPFRVAQPGLHRGEVRLAGEDACPLDDRLSIAVYGNPGLPVALVADDAPLVPYLDDAFYLERALGAGGAPTGDGGENAASAIRAARLTAAELASAPLEDFAVVICVNLPAPTPAAAQRLQQYLHGGGHVWWVLGDRVDPAAYNSANQSVGGQLLPAPLGPLRVASAARPDGWRIGMLAGDYRGLVGLSEPVSLYQSVLVRQHVQLEAAPHPAQVLARLDDGEPLLVRGSVGHGSVLVCGASLHVRSTNLPLQPLFVPLVTQLLLAEADVAVGAAQLVAGQPWELSLPGSSAPAMVEITRPDGQIVRVASEPRRSPSATESVATEPDAAPSAAPDPQVVRYDDTHDLGVYEMRVLGPGLGRRMAAAVNIDPRECDPAYLTPAELAARFPPGGLVVCGDDQRLATTIRSLRRGRDLTAWFLLLCLIALALEALVSNRLSRTEKPRSARPGRLHPWVAESLAGS